MIVRVATVEGGWPTQLARFAIPAQPVDSIRIVFATAPLDSTIEAKGLAVSHLVVPFGAELATSSLTS